MVGGEVRVLKSAKTVTQRQLPLTSLAMPTASRESPLHVYSKHAFYCWIPLESGVKSVY